MILRPHELGTYFETPFFQGLFGNKKSNIDNLPSQFPQIKFKRIKQTHGDRIVHTSPHSIDFASEADGQYSNERDLGLCISTADCIPIFLYHSEPQWVVGIHAGWRGIEKRIVPKAIAQLRKQGCDPKKLLVFIGPHIQKISFEVGNDIRDRLLSSVLLSEKDSFFSESSNSASLKSFVDLHLILKEQLQESRVESTNCYFDVKDTAADSNYHSFRRDKESSGRQISWIALK